MVFNYDMLRGRIYNQTSVPQLAKDIGVSPQTLRERLSGNPFRSDEIMKIAKLLHIDTSDSVEMNSYFFNVKCSQKRTKTTN